MSFDFLDDIHGNRSSKRLAGLRMVTINLLTKLACIVLALFIIPAAIYFLGDIEKDGKIIKAINTDVVMRYFDWAFDEINGIIDPLLYFGAALLGWSVLEHLPACFGNKSKKK